MHSSDAGVATRSDAGAFSLEHEPFDPARIKQIRTNLASNALKFTTTGGVNLKARYAGRTCTIDVMRSGRRNLQYL